ncbi:MAG: hypothetical protein WAT53_03720 [Nitrosomonas sp.]|jgi:cytochrome c556|nr:hypothetical protein [Nitrosomonas sp.]
MKKFSLILISAWIGLFSTSAISSDPDTRHVIPLNKMQRHHLLSEMRALLEGMQVILQSLAKQDMTAIAKHARSLGTEMPRTGERHLHEILPKPFVAMGMQVHRGFDQIAAEAETSQHPQTMLQQLSDITRICADCHATYQVRLRTASDHSESDEPHHHRHH